MASIYAITGIAVLLLDFGLTAVVIRWESPSQAELSTLFWLNLINGVAFVGLVGAFAPLIAAFYRQPSLSYLAPLASLSFLFSFGAVHSALLSRAGRFKQVSILTAAGGIGSTAATLALAVSGLGAVALAAGPALGALTTSVGLVAVTRWRPSPVIERAAVRRMWRFSRGVVGAQSVEYVLQNLDTVLLGRTSGPAVLGAYNRAFSLMLIPVNQVTGALGTVVYPALASMQGDRPRLKNSFEAATVVILLVVGFLVVQLALLAPDLVPLLYGDRWLASIVPLQWLCLAGLSRVTTLTTAWLLQVLGRTAVMFRLALVEATITITGIVVAVNFGADALAFAVALAGVVYLPINVCTTFAAFGYSSRVLWVGMARSLLIIGIGAVSAVVASVLLGDAAPIVRLAAMGLSGCVGFAGASLLIHRSLVLKVVLVFRRR